MYLVGGSIVTAARVAFGNGVPSGAVTKEVAVRGVGPSLGALGVPDRWRILRFELH